MRREDNENINDYIERFNSLNEELESQHGLKIPQVILSYKLLEGANVDSHTKQLIRTNCDDVDLKSITKAFSRAFDLIITRKD